MGLPGRLTIFSAVWIESTNVTDRQTDGRADTGRQQRPRLRIASRGKNCCCEIEFWKLHGIQIGRETTLDFREFREPAITPLGEAVVKTSDLSDPDVYRSAFNLH